MHYLDIIIFAAVAVFLFWRLRSVLGRKNENEQQRPNPFATPGPDRKRDDDVIRPREEARAITRDREEGDDLNIENRRRMLEAPAPNSLAGAIEMIRRADRTFDEKGFLQGAKSAFGMIVEAFAAGDTKMLQALLAGRVFAQFEGAIKKRVAAELKQETKIVRIRDCDLIAAKLEDSKAIITIKFISEQINVTRDTEGKVVEGDPKRAEEVEDIWTFSRDTKSNDPNWLLIETRS